ncbi:MAG: hypothetical protein V4699_01715 [Patescibacteria group bacterium]
MKKINTVAALRRQNEVLEKTTQAMEQTMIDQTKIIGDLKQANAALAAEVSRVKGLDAEFKAYRQTAAAKRAEAMAIHEGERQGLITALKTIATLNDTSGISFIPVSISEDARLAEFMAQRQQRHQQGNGGG